MNLGRALASLAVTAMAMQRGMAQGVSLVGTWSGEYTCAQGVTGLRLQVEDAGSDRLHGLFEFRATAANPGVLPGCFEMSGRYDPVSGHVRMTAGRWIVRPPSFVTVDLDGTITADSFRGTVIGPLCTTFELHRAVQGARSATAPCAEQGLVASSGS